MGGALECAKGFTEKPGAAEKERFSPEAQRQPGGRWHISKPAFGLGGIHLTSVRLSELLRVPALVRFVSVKAAG